VEAGQRWTHRPYPLLWLMIELSLYVNTALVQATRSNDAVFIWPWIISQVAVKS
jgi:hypothetical protein